MYPHSALLLRSGRGAGPVYIKHRQGEEEGTYTINDHRPIIVKRRDSVCREHHVIIEGGREGGREGQAAAANGRSS